MKENKWENWSVDLSVKFGSKFQREIALKSLSIVLEGWEKFFEGKNKKTEIVYFIDDSDLETQ